MKWLLVGVFLVIVHKGAAQSFASIPNGLPNRPPIFHPIPPFNPGPYRPSAPTYRFRRSPQSFASIPNGLPNRPPIFHPIPPFNPGPYRPSAPTYRFRRSPQGSVDASVSKASHGRPQLNLDYNQKFITNDKSSLSGYGGVSSPDFSHFHPHGGVNYEWTPNKNTFLGAHGGVQQLPNGRLDPSVGLNFGYRFRRDVDQQLED